MLTTSANQYLHPDYLSPLPTTWSVRGRGSQPDILDPDLGHEPLQQQLDAKKSPLALLAQTCSQIGADSPSSKPLIPPLEKQPSSKSSSSSSSSSTVKNDSSGGGSGGAREKSSPASSAGSDLSVKSSFKPYESSVSSQHHHQQRDKTGSPQEDRAGAASGNGSTRVRTPASTKSGGRCASNQSASSPRSSPVVGRKTPASAAAAAAAAAVAAATSAAADAKTTSESPLAATAKVGFSPVASSLLDPAASLKDVPLGTFKPTASYLGAFPHFPVDLMAAAAAAAGGGAAAHLKGSPYVSYARMKTPSGVDTLVPVCRDPYCTGCQLSSQLLAAAAATSSSAAGAGKGCPGGCAQCDHAGKAAFLPAAAAAAAYATAHAQLAALASHLPYVCNWIGSAAPSASSAADGSAAAAAAAAASGYCGKRFATSEELLQHLRSHTEAAVSPLFGHRAYPTPPLSPLATARYHPYGKPTPGALLPPGFPLHPHPGLPPYFSPYSLYGQRHP